MSKVKALKRNKKGQIYNPTTGLVFLSETDRRAIGRIVDDEYEEGLSKESVELCEKYGFKYDEERVHTEPQEDPQEEDEQEEEEEAADEEPHAESKEEAPVERVAPPVRVAELPVERKEEEEPPKARKTRTPPPSPKVRSDSRSDLVGTVSSLISEYIEKCNTEKAELQKKLSDTMKELEDTKKKLKKVFAAMQE